MAAFAFALRPLLPADGLSHGADTQLARRLVRMAARTLVLELNLARRQGLLEGATPSERFTYFTRTLDLSGLLTRYPVLARLLYQAVRQAVEAHQELLRRFAEDRAEIVATLLDGVDPGSLVAVETGKGDAHRRGRSVTTLRFADGRRVVYRPRPIDLHAHFNAQLGWLSARTSIALRTVALVPRDGYGWLEFAEQAPCADVTEVGAFYHRLGALLALLYAVDGTDMHFENLIACGDQPVLIDVETLFHPTLVVGDDPAALALASSVHRTALLPQMMLGDNGIADISGLGGDRGATLPVDAVGWADPGTDRMRLIRTPASAAGASNRPRIGDHEAEPAEYQAALSAGFHAGYDAIVGHREELLALVRECADDEIRFVARPTQLYARLLDESTHPDVLRDPLDRDLALDLLWAESQDDELLRALVPHEIGDLWAGDVPLVCSRPGSADLWTASGERLPDLLPCSGLDAVERKIAALGEVDRHDQQWLISAALASRPKPVEHRGGEPLSGQVTPTAPDAQRLLAAACGIADQILARAAIDGERMNWVGLELVDDRHWAVLPMGAGLSNGYTGVALFLAQLGALTGAARYLDAAHRTTSTIPRLLQAFAAEPEMAAAVGNGGFHGLGGITYALSRMTTLLGSDPLLVDAALALMPDSDAFDVVDGTAGALAAMISVHAETGLPSAEKLVCRYTDQLATMPVSGTGFARGAAGVDWALGRPASAAVPVDDVSWCSGLAGLVLAGAPGLERHLVEREPLRDMSLCHGELGVTEALAALADRGDEDAQAAVTRRAGLLLGALDEYGARCGTPGAVASPGLLTGLAGIGYGLLRLGFAERVPSVLLLSAPHHNENNEG
ncbi:type 2 lantipeptide synthetase LanM [Lentzea tibetensis]|uniref:Type 2 lantipeptide synthetase LanM n=2 Tax=Lentzea tibetensis TaxID=2591470 RepID=A0A563EIY2_9PSEU|nr:type 2 lantipeptide synthetase LanM [Lentzea tibetensis]